VETRPINGGGGRHLHHTEHRLGCDAMMAGISTLGLRVLDVLRAYDYLSQRPDTGVLSITGVGSGALLAYLAGVLEPGWAEVRVEGLLTGFQSIVETRFYDSGRFNLKSAAWGILRPFDLADLAVCLKPRLQIVDSVNAHGERVSGEQD